jgi:ketosteroid isomerase-like protein
MPSDEAVVRGTFEAMSAARGTPIEDRDALMERWFDEEVEYVEDENWPGATSYRGRRPVRDAFAGYEEILGGDLTVEDVRAGTGGLLAIIHYVGESTGASVPWDQRWAYHCRVRDGRISYFRAFVDVGEAERAAGVSSSSSP